MGGRLDGRIVLITGAAGGIGAACARRLAAENQVKVAEIWSYHTIGDQTRFTMVHRTPTPEPRRAPAEKALCPHRA